MEFGIFEKFRSPKRLAALGAAIVSAAILSGCASGEDDTTSTVTVIHEVQAEPAVIQPTVNQPEVIEVTQGEFATATGDGPLPDAVCVLPSYSFDPRCY